MMKLYWFKAQAPLRVLALVKHLNLKVHTIELDVMQGGLHTPEYAALNPNQKAPTLVDGDKALWESSAIMAYLCIKEGSDMWPAQNPAEQVEVLRWLSWNDNHWAGAVGAFYFQRLIRPELLNEQPDDAVLKAEAPNVEKWAAILNDHLNGREYVACNRLTIADFQLASMARYWRQTGMPFQNAPHIVRWLDHLNCLPAWADPWPVTTKAAA